MEYSRFVAVCFTLNYIIGSGFLTLPWAFLQTGVILGTLVMIVFAFLSIIAIYLLLETMERAVMVAQVERESSMSALELRRYFSINHNGGTRVSESSSMLELGDSKMNEMDVARSSSLGDDVDNPLSASEDSINSAEMILSERIEHTKRKFEIPEMCYMFLGKRGIESYTLCATLYLYGTLWAYSSVFGKAFSTYAAVFGGSLYFNYVIYLFFFALLVVPASMFEFHEQIAVQVSLTVFRVIMVVLMISTIAIAHFNRDVEFSHSAGSNGSSSNAAMFRPENLYILMPIAGYAYVFHHSIPSLAHPVPEAHKSSLSMIFSTAILISFVAYVCMAVTVSSYFQADTMSPSNLNWADYVGRAGDGIVGGPPYYARVISFFIVIFPAIDVASAYPLNACTLGNNLMSYYYGENIVQFEKSRFLSGTFRFVAACPPIIAASLVSDLGSITDYTGLAGFAIVFAFPALLARSSARKCDLLGLDKGTRFSGMWTGATSQNILLVTGTTLIIYVGFSLIYNSAR